MSDFFWISGIFLIVLENVVVDFIFSLPCISSNSYSRSFLDSVEANKQINTQNKIENRVK